ncbi:VG15 protein [Arthrobacter sp. MDT1-65]
MATATQVAEFREQSQSLVALAQSDLADFWGSLDVERDPFAARDNVSEFLPELVAAYGNAEALIAADFYDMLRDVPPSAASFNALMADPPNVPEQFRAVASWAIGPLLSPVPDALTALTRLDGAVNRLVMEPNRATIIGSVARDKQAVGWQRNVRAGSCRFCQMLAARGGVYKRETALVAAHDHCQCSAVPSWDQWAPEVPAYAYVASQTTAGMSPEQREVHRERIRDYLDANFPVVDS